MVLAFFRGGGDAFDSIEQEISSMLGDCRHSFDLAMGALITSGDIAPIGDEVRATDRLINGAEGSVRRELLVHSTVRGGGDVNEVFTSLLIVKKLERVGDQAKNVFDLADEGVRFSDADDIERFHRFHAEVSGLIAEAATMLRSVDEDDRNDFLDRSQRLMDHLDRLVNELIHSDHTASYAVPRAMLFRYLKRIVANVAGVVSTTYRPLDRSDDPDVDE